MARRDYKEQRVPLGDVTNTRNQDVAPKKKEQEILKTVSAATLVCSISVSGK